MEAIKEGAHKPTVDVTIEDFTPVEHKIIAYLHNYLLTHRVYARMFWEDIQRQYPGKEVKLIIV